MLMMMYKQDVMGLEPRRSSYLDALVLFIDPACSKSWDMTVGRLWQWGKREGWRRCQDGGAAVCQ